MKAKRPTGLRAKMAALGTGFLIIAVVVGMFARRPRPAP